MASALTVLKRNKSGAGLDAIVQVTLSGSYPALGEPLNFQAAVGLTNRAPSFVNFVGNAGFIYQWDTVNSKLRIRVNDAGGLNAAMAEHSATTYAAPLMADVVLAYVFWRVLPGLPV